MSSDKKKEYVAAVMEIEMVQPILKVWNVYTQAAEQHKCAAKFLCEINRRERVAPNKRLVKIDLVVLTYLIN